MIMAGLKSFKYLRYFPKLAFMNMTISLIVHVDLFFPLERTDGERRGATADGLEGRPSGHNFIGHKTAFQRGLSSIKFAQ